MFDLKGLVARTKGKGLLLLLGALGLLLLLFSGSPLERDEESAAPLAAAEAYRASLEEELALLCEQVSGVGEARVFLSLASGEIAVYEKNQSGSGQSVASAGGEALLLAYRPPEIAGVAVVCRGGASATVQRELTSLLSTALSVGASQIHIAPLK